MALKRSVLIKILAAIGLAACVRNSGSVSDLAPSPGSGNPTPVSTANADGGWIGSGGELVGDGHNPWFLSNTEEIRYCIKHDPDSFSASIDKTTELIEKAFAYWNKEFTNLQPLLPPPLFAPMGGHRVIRVPCDGSENVTFIAGFSQLTQEQRDFLKRPKSFLALAVRTSYDKVNLRGKGFVFIASDLGPDAYKETEGAIEKPWSHPGLLLRVLAHEIGHVFGVPHTDQETGIIYSAGTKRSVVKYSLMQESFPEYIITNPKDFQATENLSRFFGLAENYETCSLSDFARAFFKLNEKQKCLRLELNRKGKKGDPQAHIYTRSEEPSAAETLVATMPDDENPQSKYNSVTMLPVITVKITPEQSVLERSRALPMTVSGPGFFTIDSDGGTLVLSGTTRKIPVHFRLETHRAILMVADDEGKMHFLID